MHQVTPDRVPKRYAGSDLQTQRITRAKIQTDLAAFDYRELTRLILVILAVLLITENLLSWRTK